MEPDIINTILNSIIRSLRVHFAVPVVRGCNAHFWINPIKMLGLKPPPRRARTPPRGKIIDMK